MEKVSVDIIIRILAENFAAGFDMIQFPAVDRNLVKFSTIHTTPFPHFVCDELFSEGVLKLIDQNWPTFESFSESGLPGNAMFLFNSSWNSLTSQNQAFWHDFCWGPLKQIYEETFAKYFQFYIGKYGQLLKNINVHVRLMEMHPNFVDHEIHTHHWHDPCWLFTNLIYIDQNHELLPGTTLFGTPRANNYNEQAKIAAQTLLWEDMIDDVIPSITVKYQSNRMLSFIDSPVSYHGVLKTHQQPRETQTRRVIRCHASAPLELIPKLYAMEPEEYRLHRRRASTKDFVINFLEKEISSLFQSQQTSDPKEFDCEVNKTTLSLDVP